jgi:hypothetical protein
LYYTVIIAGCFKVENKGKLDRRKNSISGLCGMKKIRALWNDGILKNVDEWMIKL